VAAVVHYHGVETRILRSDIPPFFFCQLRAGNRPIELGLKALYLDAYKPSGVRISRQFAWIDWLDSRELPSPGDEWKRADFDVSYWTAPIAKRTTIGEFKPLRIGSIRHQIIRPKLIGEGTLVGPFDVGDQPNWPAEGDVTWYQRNLHPAHPASTMAT